MFLTRSWKPRKLSPALRSGGFVVDKVALPSTGGWVARHGRTLGDCRQLGARRGRKPFTVNSLAHILNNRAYIGEYRYGDIGQIGAAIESISSNFSNALWDDHIFRFTERLLLPPAHGAQKGWQHCGGKYETGSLIGAFHTALICRILESSKFGGVPLDLFLEYSTPPYTKTSTGIRSYLFEKLASHQIYIPFGSVR